MRSRSTSPKRRRSDRARGLLVAFIVLAAGAPVALLQASAEVPPPPDVVYNFGVFDRLSHTQQVKAEKTDPALVEPLTTPIVDRFAQPIRMTRSPLTAAYTVSNDSALVPSPTSLFDDLQRTPLPGYASVFDFLVTTGPLSYAVFTNCTGNGAWSNGSLRPTLDLTFSGSGPLNVVDWDRWVEIDCDANPGTGNATGHDLRVRVTPIIQNLHIKPGSIIGGGGLPQPPTLVFFGGASIEIERLGPATPVRPVDVAVFKSFSYNDNNYIWFVDFDLPDTPAVFNTTFTSDEVELQGGNLQQIILEILQNGAGSVGNQTYISELVGPYRLGWNSSTTFARFNLSGGYARYFNPSGTPTLQERTWFNVGLTPAEGELSVPSQAVLRLDSEGFNKSFDFLEWNASGPSALDVEYFDERENFTYAHAVVRDLPAYMQATVDQIGTGDNATAVIHYRAAEPVELVNYDEFIFLGNDPTRRIYTHVRLEDLPTEIIVNGTLDVGGTVTEPLLGPRSGISVIGEIIDRMMIRIASKLYSVGQTLRAIPNNILNLPDEKGWVSIDLPQGGEIGSLEFWLTSGNYVLANGNYVAFYNDTTPVTPPGAVGTSLSGRLGHIQCLIAGFFQTRSSGTHCLVPGTVSGTMLTLVTSGGEPFTALFIDLPQNASAQALISNLPPIFSFRIEEMQVVYSASNPVDYIEYTSVIQKQYTRIRMEQLPPYVALNQTPGNVRVDTQFNAQTGAGQIALFEMQVSDVEPYSLPGDHVMVYQNDTVNASSARVHDIRSLTYVQGAGGHVTLHAKGGTPFAMAFINRSTPLDALLYFDPLPSELDVTLPGALQSVQPITLPSLGTLSSVIDFSHIIFGIDSFGRSIVETLGQVGVNIANGVGRFDQNFSLAFDSTGNTTLIGAVRKGAWSSVDDVQWVHGVRSRQRLNTQDNGSLDLTSKFFLTGLPRHMEFSLNVEAEVLIVNATLQDFTPRFDYLAIETEAASADPNDQPKNIRFFADGFLPHTDLQLAVTFRSDLSIGGQVVGDMAVNATSPLTNFYVRMTTAQPRPSVVEVLIPEIPVAMVTRAEMGEGISISHRAFSPIEFVFVRMGRGIVGPDESSFAIFHDVPTQVDMIVPAPKEFDMQVTNPIRSLPNITLSASSEGLDLVADLNGKALGSRGSIRFFANDVGRRLTMLTQGNSYAVSSDGVSRLLLEMDQFPLAEGFAIDALSIYAEDVRTVTFSMQTVFESFPIVSVDNLNAGRTELRFEHRIQAISGVGKPTTLIFVSIPVGRGEVAVYSNGIVTAPESSGRHVIVPAPVLSLLLSQF